MIIEKYSKVSFMTHEKAKHAIDNYFQSYHMEKQTYVKEKEIQTERFAQQTNNAFLAVDNLFKSRK